jgi:hypothetical protein
MRHLTPALLAVLACGGPAATSRQIRGPDGQDNWVAIVCKGVQMNCYARAGEVCPMGYEVADSEGHEGQASSGFANSYYAVYKSGHTYAGELLIRCRGTPVGPLGRDCLDEGSCDTGDTCVFSEHASMGHCARSAQR